MQRIESSQSRLFETQKIQSRWDEREKWYKRVEKRIIFVTNATKTKDLIISSFLMKNDLFDEIFVLINCVLRDKILTIAMIDINVIEYAFVDESVAQSLCEALKIESVQLIKKRLVRVYDERKDQIITHVIYSKMIIQRHIGSLIFMLIIKLRQQTLILNKSWMRKHDVNYHEKTNIIEFYSEFCTHSKKIETVTTDKEKNIHFEKNLFWINQITSNLTIRLKTRENSRWSSSKFFFEKKLILINHWLIFFEKTKNKQNQSITKIRKRLEISDSILISSKS